MRVEQPTTAISWLLFHRKLTSLAWCVVHPATANGRLYWMTNKPYYYLMVLDHGGAVYQQKAGWTQLAGLLSFAELQKTKTIIVDQKGIVLYINGQEIDSRQFSMEGDPLGHHAPYTLLYYPYQNLPDTAFPMASAANHHHLVPRIKDLEACKMRYLVRTRIGNELVFKH